MFGLRIFAIGLLAAFVAWAVRAALDNAILADLALMALMIMRGADYRKIKPQTFRR